ncbi:MAG: sigma-54-dependent transcriptional regulator [Spirochaetia bacterium]
MSRVLVIDDEQGICDVLRDILEDEGYDVFVAEEGYEGLRLLRTEPIDVVLLDIWLPNRGGMDILKDIKEEFPATEVILITGHGTIDLAVKSVKLGAFDFLEKPLSLDRVTTLVRNADKMEKLRRENRELRDTLDPGQEIIGESPPMKDVLARVGQSASTDSRILITGENGTGKELIARKIHRNSARRTGPFIAVNCAAIPDTLLESELFGHEKGAFTGAASQRRGKFELADGGTLFLDEVADMSLSAQAKVLRVTQELQFERVGGDTTLSVDVRIIAATNKDIAQEVAQKTFREDLYFRLNVIPIHVPALRDRPEDIPLLFEHYASVLKQDNAAVKRLTPEAVEKLQTYHWPGNIRELKNLVERVTIMSDEEEVTAGTVEALLGHGSGRREESLFDDFEGKSLGEARDEFEKRLLERKLAENGNNITRTAQALGVYPSNLHGKIKKFGISIER